MSELQIQMLSTVEVRRREESVRLSGRRLRTLLALLALHTGETVAVDVLVRGLWDEAPPVSARASLQSLIARLRRAIGEETIETTTSGYRLTVPREAIDVLRFRDAVAAAATESDPEREREGLAAALAHWRGDPFGESLSDWVERHEVPQLEEEHLAALERRIDLDLEAGDAEHVVPELFTLTGRFPIREPLWTRLLRALRDAGRTAEALHAYDKVRMRLADELGTDPGADLQQVHRELLTTDELEAPTQSWRPPRQLPRTPAQFVGRQSELRQLDRALGSAGLAPILVVHGPSGVGKTSLTLRWAGEVAGQFPDGQLFVDLHGFDEHSVAPLSALETLLRSLGVSSAELPKQEQDAAALFRSIMAERICLVVLDNARDPAQVRPLLPGGDSLVLVTSRSQMRSLAAREAAHRIAVDLLPESEAVTMLASRAQRVTTRYDELAELAALCGRLPMALTVVAERVAREPGALDEVLAHLRDETRRLDELTTGDDPLTDVRAAFNGSYAQLDADTAKGFRLLGLHPDTPINKDVVAVLLGAGLDHTRRLLDRLVGWHLLHEVDRDWYGMHDLVRAFSRDRLLAQEPAESSAAARSRLRTWYSHSVFAATSPGEQSGVVDLPELAANTRPRSFTNKDESMSWLAVHRPVISRLVRAAAEDGDGIIASRLAVDFAVYLESICAETEGRKLCRIGVAAARSAGAAANEAACLNRLGMRLAHDEEYEESIECFLRGAELFASIEETIGEHRMADNAALVHCLAGRPEQAEELLLRRLSDLERRGLAEEIPPALNQLAEIQLALDRPRAAIETATKAAKMLALGSQGRLLAIAMYKIAKGCAALGDIDGATSAFSRAADTYKAFGDLNETTQALEELGLLQIDHGRAGAAVQSWSTALELLDGADAAVADQRREKLQSLLTQAKEEVAQAARLPAAQQVTGAHANTANPAIPK